jgi:hypothetical protein
VRPSQRELARFSLPVEEEEKRGGQNIIGVQGIGCVGSADLAPDMLLHEFVEIRPAGLCEVMARLEEPQDEALLVSEVSALKEFSELPLRFSLPAEGGVALLSHHAKWGAASVAEVAEVGISVERVAKHPRHCCDRGEFRKFDGKQVRAGTGTGNQ